MLAPPVHRGWAREDTFVCFLDLGPGARGVLDAQAAGGHLQRRAARRVGSPCKLLPHLLFTALWGLVQLRSARTRRARSSRPPPLASKSWVSILLGSTMLWTTLRAVLGRPQSRVVCTKSAAAIARPDKE